MKQSANARRRLDERFQHSSLHDLPRPHRGWIRAVRDALGMSTTELATRMGVRQQSIADLERSEQRETAKLDTLQRAARAMDCELFYAIVPRTSLDEIVRARAHQKAHHILATVSHHSRLEDQAVTDLDLASQIEEIAEQLIDRRGLWTNNQQANR